MLQFPSHSNPVLGGWGGGRSSTLPGEQCPSLPGWAYCVPLLPSLPSLSPPLPSHYYNPPPPFKQPAPSNSSPRTEVSFDVAMEMPHGRNVKGGSESAGGERVQPSVLEPACLKTSRGRESERMRERRRGRREYLCRHHSPWGLM